jgi:hypothetical protein
VPPSGLQDLLNRYPCRDERDEPGPVKIGFEAFLKVRARGGEVERTNTRDAYEDCTSATSRTLIVAHDTFRGEFPRWRNTWKISRTRCSSRARSSNKFIRSS